MKRLRLALLLYVVGISQVFGGTAPDSATFRVVKVDPRLRSAFLLREMGLPVEYRYSEATGLKSQLQTHFDAVLEKLELNRERSLAIAMARLERRQGVRWTAAQRRYWHNYLSEQRDVNIERLTAYRDRGLFPLNEGQDADGAPIFVDNHDTACAVGHLMRESGWEREVELIATTNLLVYVTDVRDGPLVNWVLQSGLTLGEAALIQPVYSPPISQINFDTLSGTGAGFTAPATFFNGTDEQTIANGLRYENFRWRRLTNITSRPGTTEVIEFPDGSGNFIFIGNGGIKGAWQVEAPSNIGVRTDYQEVHGRPDCEPCLPDPGTGFPYANLLTVAPDENTLEIGWGLSAYSLSFDVVANHPALAIDRIGIFIPGSFSQGFVEAWAYVSESPAALEVAALPYDPEDPISAYMVTPGNLLDSLHIARFSPTSPLKGSTTFAPLERVTVHTFMLARVEEVMSGSLHYEVPGRLGAVVHEVRLVSLVPEPSCAALACCFAIGLVWRRN